MHHHLLDHSKISSNSYTWEASSVPPFDELLISWNAKRPEKGHFAIYVSVDSPWLLYAKWGATFQKGSVSNADTASVYQDAVNVPHATHFKIRVVAKDGADLKDFRSFHVCASITSSLTAKPLLKPIKSHSLNFSGLSQMALPDPRKERLCSPTSTTAVVRYLQKTNPNPLDFAEKCWDSHFDIFGNWVFNTAEAFTHLTSHSCWVQRYSSFQPILDALYKDLPTIISVRSPLPGSAEEYKEGHLIVVTGFDAQTEEVLCMDPAFPCNTSTNVRYKLSNLLVAWERRKNIAYVFDSML